MAAKIEGACYGFMIGDKVELAGDHPAKGEQGEVVAFEVVYNHRRPAVVLGSGVKAFIMKPQDAKVLEHANAKTDQ